MGHTGLRLLSLVLSIVALAGGLLGGLHFSLAVTSRLPPSRSSPSLGRRQRLVPAPASVDYTGAAVGTGVASA